MQLTTKEGSSRTDTIAFALLVLAVGTAMVAFALGRNDASVRTAVLLCVTNLVTALASIGATLLVGKPATTHALETREPARVAISERQTAGESQTTTSVLPVHGPQGDNRKTEAE